MDLNHTPLTKYNHDKLSNPYHYHISNQSDTSHTQTIAEEIRTQEASLNNQRNTTNLSELDLKNGQMLRGEVVDHLGNRVSIRLESSEHIVTARLESNIALPVGETAQFQVLEVSSGKMLLKLISTDLEYSSDATIEKALTASRLPLTTRNKALVLELLNHRMSVDKNTLQTMVKLSHKYPEASPLSIVLMTKYDIPITKENIAQFEAYQNGTKEFSNQIESILKNIGKLLQSFKNTAAINDQSIVLQHIPSDSIPNEANPIVDNIQNSPIGRMDHPIMDGNHNLQTSLTYDNTLDKLLFINRSLLELLEPNSNSGSEINSDQLNSQVHDVVTDRIPFGKENPAIAIPGNMQTHTDLGNFDTTLELNTVLSPPEIENLIEEMHSFPDAGNIINEIKQCNASIQNVLNYIKHNLTRLEKTDAASFLSTEEYGKLIEAALHHKWSLTPERLAKKDVIKEFYQDLERDLKILRNIMQPEKEASESLRFQEPVKNLQENIDFLKDINQVFTYLPLPIQLKDQETHCDLYVLTRKKALKNPKEGLTVLLHLTMTNLGALNVHIHMADNQISAKFYMENASSIQLLSENMEKLSNALKEKGYSLHAEVLGSYKKPEFTNDFLEADLQDSLIQRYSFDIRT